MKAASSPTKPTELERLVARRHPADPMRIVLFVLSVVAWGERRLYEFARRRPLRLREPVGAYLWVSADFPDAELLLRPAPAAGTAAPQPYAEA